MGGAGEGIGWYNGFNLQSWCESRGGEVESLKWSIEGDIDPETGDPAVPENLKGCAPVLMEFDAEKKQLYISRSFCKLYGVDVVIGGD